MDSTAAIKQKDIKLSESIQATEEKAKESASFIKKSLDRIYIKLVIIGIIIILAPLSIIACKAYLTPSVETTNKLEVTTIIVQEKLADVGELITQEDRITEIEKIVDKLYIKDFAIPGSTKELTYSYDVVVKAGYDFSKIDVSIKDQVITVKLPKEQITDCYIENEKLIEEESSLINPTKGDEFIARKAELQKQALEKAETSGIYELAKENAQNLIIDLLQYDGYVVSFR